MPRDYLAELNNAFTYHSPSEAQILKYQKLREKAKEYALLIFELCPESPDRTRAINMVSDANMIANASIARAG